MMLALIVIIAVFLLIFLGLIALVVNWWEYGP
jgi:hypothetical protein